MPVNTTHPDYRDWLPIWRRNRDAVDGDRAVKRMREVYLPASFADTDPDRYEQYISRAHFMGVTGRTLRALLGMVFRKPAILELPPAMLQLAENINGSGQSLEQMAKRAVSDVQTVGRYGVLADYSNVPQGADRATEAAIGARPTLAPYPAESIINWRMQSIWGRQRLSLVVLKELVHNPKSNDRFEIDEVEQYRVLEMRNGVYVQTLFDAEGRVIVEEFAPRMPGGATFDYIPFRFAGADDNLPTIDPPPISDLVAVNMGHFQVTADHRENLFIHGQLTLGVSTDLSFEEFKIANPAGVVVGARVGHYLGKGGSFSSVTAPESSSLRAALADMESQMVALGARLVQRGGQAETAESARINASAEASTLDLVVNNVSEAFEEALEDLARFTGDNPDMIQYRLNTQFWDQHVSSQDLQAIISGVGKAFGPLDALEMIRAGRIVLRDDRSNDDILQDAASAALDEDIGGVN